MRMNKLGRTGLFVSELCLGTMTFGGGGEVWSKIGALGQEDAERLIGQAIDWMMEAMGARARQLAAARRSNAR